MVEYVIISDVRHICLLRPFRLRRQSGYFWRNINNKEDTREKLGSMTFR